MQFSYCGTNEQKVEIEINLACCALPVVILSSPRGIQPPLWKSLLHSELMNFFLNHYSRMLRPPKNCKAFLIYSTLKF